MLTFLKPLFASTPRLDPAEAVRLVTSGAAILADVREADELRTGGKAKGALHLPLSTLARTSDRKSGHFERKLQAALEGGKPLILYCASGARSGRAAGMLRANGFAKVHNLGSLRDWAAGGGVVQR